MRVKRKLLKSLAVAACVCAVGVGGTSLFSFGNEVRAEENEAISDSFELTNASVSAVSEEIPSHIETDYRSGIKFKVNSSGSYIDYMRTIDLRKVEGNLIEFIPNAGLQSFGLTSLQIRLTDAYDASNSITVSWKVNPDGPRLLNEGGASANLVKNSLTLCSAFVQVGFMGVAGAYPNYSAEPSYTIGWRQIMLPSYDYTPGYSNPFLPCGVSYDIETNSVIMQSEGTQYPTVMDLDDEDDDYPDFGGFTTGEVLLTIESTGSSGEFICTKIGNDSMADLVGGSLSAGGLMFNGYDFENMVNGVVGYSYLMPVSANKNPVTVKLEKLEGETCIDVTDKLIENGTKFVPDETGKYRLTYTGKTNAGKDASIGGDFEVIANPVEITEKESVSLSAEIASAFVVPSLEYEGGIGSLSAQYSLTIGDRESSVVPGDAFLIDEKGLSLTLTVRVVDKVGYSKTFEYPITVDENVKEFSIVGFDCITIAKGDKVTVPDFIANDYVLSDIDCKGSVVITSSLQSGVLKVGDTLTVESSATIDYTWGEKVISYRIICAPKSITKDNIGEMFQNDGVSSVAASSIGTEFTLSCADVTISMPNPVAASDLTIEYSLYSRYGLDKNQFSAVNIILQSLSGDTLTLCIDRCTALRPTMTVNGKKGKSLSTYTDSYVNASDLKTKFRKFSLSFDERTAAVYNGNGDKVCDVTTWENGLPFDGFEDGKVLVKFELVGGQSGNKFVLNTLSNQKFADINLIYGDMIAPALSLKGELKNAFMELGSTVNVPMAYAYDVLSNKSSIYMTVRTPDGDLYTKAAPVAFELQLTKSGKYIVSYTVSDKNRNSFTYEYVYNVLDKQAPEIDLEQEYQQSYSGKVTVISATVSDNNDSASTKASLYILLENPDLSYDIVAANQTLTLSKGKYAILYYAMDADGNLTMVRRAFEVK